MTTFMRTLVGLVTLGGLTLVLSAPTFAEQKAGSSPRTDTPQARLHPKAIAPAGETKAAMEPKTTTLTGRIVDLRCYMTNEYPSADHAKCTTDSIKAGVPAALETSTGLVMLGQGMKGIGDKLVPLAWQHVEVKGKLYEHHGLKYIDFTSVEKAASAASVTSAQHPTRGKDVSKRSEGGGNSRPGK